MSESDDYRCHILTTEVEPRTVRVNVAIDKTNVNPLTAKHNYGLFIRNKLKHLKIKISKCE